MPESPVHGWISETQNAIRSVISKPKATDRLLNRPPFRFLYDVITGIMSSTGYCFDSLPEKWRNPGREFV